MKTIFLHRSRPHDLEPVKIEPTQKCLKLLAVTLLLCSSCQLNESEIYLLALASLKRQKIPAAPNKKMSCLNFQSVTQEGRFFCVDFAELGLDVLLGEDGEVFVQNFAPERLVAVEVAHHVLRVLGNIEEFLLLGYLRVLAVPLLQPVLFLLLGLLHRI